VTAVAGAQASEIEVPAELRSALAEAPDAAGAFAALAPSHRREYAQWIAEAKREQTRRARAAKAVEMLRGGETRSG
jgi:uncharacterized protein YdeI (YjbR/CyaY-like superfamily)